MEILVYVRDDHDYKKLHWLVDNLNLDINSAVVDYREDENGYSWNGYFFDTRKKNVNCSIPKDRIISLRKEGKSYSQIGAELGCSKVYAQKVVKEAERKPPCPSSIKWQSDKDLEELTKKIEEAADDAYWYAVDSYFGREYCNDPAAWRECVDKAVRLGELAGRQNVEDRIKKSVKAVYDGAKLKTSNKILPQIKCKLIWED